MERLLEGWRGERAVLPPGEQQQAAEPLVISMIADGIWKQPMSMIESAWLAK